MDHNALVCPNVAVGSGFASAGLVLPNTLANLDFWYEAAAANIVDDGGGVVSQWTDLAANYNGTASGSERPSFVDGALPAIRFDGTTNVLRNTSYTPSTNGYTIFCICSFNSGDTIQAVYELTADAVANNGVRFVYATDTLYNTVYLQAGGSVAVTKAVALPITAKLYTLWFDPVTTNTMKVYENGVQVSTTQTGATALKTGINRLTIGANGSAASYLLKGDMHMLWGFKRALTDIEITSQWNYGRAKFPVY